MAETRQKLLNELLSAVQKCQVRYGGKSELATENEEVVSKLCRSLEAVFSHGLKANPSKAGSFALKQMTDLVSQNIGGFLLSSPSSAGAASAAFASTSTSAASSQPPSMWNFVKKHLNRHELERYMLLKTVNTDPGRGRAWLRAALNEHSLERYVHLFMSDAEILEQHYETSAFMRDQERSSMLPAMAAGLGSILFAITIDNSVLNEATDIFVKIDSHEKSILAASSTAAKTNDGDSTSCSSKGSSIQTKKKKHRKPSTKIVEFDESGSSHERVLTSSPRIKPEVEKSIPKSEKREIESPGSVSDLSYDSVTLRSTSSTDKRDPRLRRRSHEPSVSSGTNDLDADTVDIDASSAVDDASSANPLSALTPIRNVEIGALIPISSVVNGTGSSGVAASGPNNMESREDAQSEDSMSMHSFTESDYGSVFTELPSSNTNMAESAGGGGGGGGGKSVSGMSRASSVGGAISREDLKQALLSVMSRKDELQGQCAALKKLLEQEASVTAGLHEELRECRRKFTETNDKLTTRIQTLGRENELLKHQLKKYVGAVQKLRDGPMAYETLAQLEDQYGGKSDGSSKYVDYHFEASEFEKKLIQVAEMHGELLEFNEHLQKSLHTKDLLIRRLRDELVDLRGPLPHEENDVQDDVISLASEADSMTTSIISTSSVNKLSLINIWIPSVFLSGAGNKTHHVYQVYLKMGSEEWNVYRRYSEFYALHKDLQQREKTVASFDFPPKKTVGYKADKVVEDRRKRLQAYLRCVVNLMVKMNPALLAKPDKEHVILLMPFFAESVSRLGRSPISPSIVTASVSSGSSGSSAAHRFFQRHTDSGRGHRGGEAMPQLAL